MAKVTSKASDSIRFGPLEDPRHRNEFADDVDWQRVDTMLDFGGIRIEDDVLVTDGEPKVLTAAIDKFVF